MSADAVDAGPMLLMLVVSWPRSACVSNVLALGMLPHVCLSMFGGKLVCCETHEMCEGHALLKGGREGHAIMKRSSHESSKALAA